MKLDDDKEAVAILQNGIGAYNNRARAIYNKGYQQGLKDGKREAIKMLMQNIDTMKAEPQTSGVVWTEDAIKNEPKSYTTWASTDESQTDCPWK